MKKYSLREIEDAEKKCARSGGSVEILAADVLNIFQQFPDRVFRPVVILHILYPNIREEDKPATAGRIGAALQRLTIFRSINKLATGQYQYAGEAEGQ